MLTFLGVIILLTHAVLVMLTSYTVATTEDARARLHGLSYLLGLFILGQLVWMLPII